MEKPKKLTKDEIFTTARTKARSTDQSEIIVNGKRMTVSEYFKDPVKYNAEPIDPQFVKQVQEQHKESVKLKAKLQIDPSTLKTLL